MTSMAAAIAASLPAQVTPEPTPAPAPAKVPARMEGFLDVEASRDVESVKLNSLVSWHRQDKQDQGAGQGRMEWTRSGCWKRVHTRAQERKRVGLNVMSFVSVSSCPSRRVLSRPCPVSARAIFVAPASCS